MEVMDVTDHAVQTRRYVSYRLVQSYGAMGRAKRAEWNRFWHFRKGARPGKLVVMEVLEA